MNNNLRNKVIIWVLIATAFALILCVIGNAEAKTWYVDDSGGADFEKIQDAVDVSEDGDTIKVYEGFYRSIIVDKSINIIGNGSINTTIWGWRETLVRINSDWVNLSGFTIRGNADTEIGIFINSNHTRIFKNNCTNNGYLKSGIYLYSANNNLIINNTLYENYYGISLRFSTNNTIFNNTCTNNVQAIYFEYSDYNLFKNNTCYENVIKLYNSNMNNLINNTCLKGGIKIDSSSNNILLNNSMIDNGIYIDGTQVEHWNTHLIDNSNTVNKKHVHYIKNQTNGIAESDAGQVILVNCSNFIVENQNCSNTSIGILLAYSSNISVNDNTCNNNSVGIKLVYSNNTTIRNNTCTSCGCGLRFSDSKNNTLTNNTCTYSWMGIDISQSDYNKIINNNCSNTNYEGIHLWGSSFNIIFNNTFSYNDEKGINIFYGSDNNNIANNTCSYNEYGIYVASDYNTLMNNTCSFNAFSGIELGHSKQYNTITNNTCLFNNYGIYLYESIHNVLKYNKCSYNNVDGIFISSDLPPKSTYNIVENNICNYNFDNAIHIKNSNNNIISDNTCSYNIAYGIYLYFSSDNKLLNNNCSFNIYGIGLVQTKNNILSYNKMVNNGIVFRGYYKEYWNTHSIDSTNIINYKPVYYYKNQTGGSVPLGAGQVILAHCSNILVKNQNCSNSSVGILLGYSSNININNNTCSSNHNEGIFLFNSDNNNLRNNRCFNNSNGINFDFTSDNNNISNNTCNFNKNGIMINSVSNIINNNSCLYNDIGIDILETSHNNILINNSCSNNNKHGIYIYESNDNNLIDNICSFNKENGIYLYKSKNSILLNNTLFNEGIVISGNSIEYWNTHSINTTNTVNGKSVFYYKNKEGGTVPIGAGQIILANCTNMVVENQNCSNGSIGILIGYSLNNTFINNKCLNNKNYGIYLHYSSDNTFNNNTYSANENKGIGLHYSDHNTIINNSCSFNNKYGIELYHSDYNTLINNNNSFNNQGGIQMYYSDNNNLKNNICSYNNYRGIDFLESNNNLISNINCTFNRHGIDLHHSSCYNEILNCNISDNDEYGIYVYSSANDNKIYHNNFINNSAYDRCSNLYDDGLEGNYWSNYEGPDNNADGIGDWQYFISSGSNSDRFPLMKPIEPLPKIRSTNPYDGDEEVQVDTKISITFSKEMNKTATESAYSILPFIGGEFSWDKNTMIFSPYSDLEYNTTYKVTISSKAKDLDGNNISLDYNFKFTTIEEPENILPIANAGDDQIIYLNEEVYLTGSGADIDGEIIKYEWDFEGDGTYDWESTTTGETTHIYTIKGKYQPELRVTDNDGNVATDICNITVMENENQQPIAIFEQIFPNPAYESQEIWFFGNGTDDGTIQVYEWRSSIDGILSNENNFSLSNMSNGTHVIYFKVKDNFDIWSDEVLTTLTINGIPKAKIDEVKPNPANENEIVHFYGNGTDDGEIKRYVWKSNIDGELIDGLTNDYYLFGNNYELNKTSGNPSELKIIAKFQDYGFVRINREWVDVGTWTYNVSNDEIILHNKVMFNIWYKEIDEGFENDPDWQFSIKYNGEYVGNEEILESYSHPENASLIRAQVDLIRDIIPKVGDSIEIYIQYRGWENCTVYLNNVSYESNVFLSENEIPGISYEIMASELSLGEHRIYLKVMDNFGIWSDEVSTLLIINPSDNQHPTINLISPIDDSTVTLTSTTFKWDGNDDDGDILTYDVYLDTNPNPSTKVSTEQTEEYYSLYDLTNEQIYYWKVVVYDGKKSVESAIWRFTVDINSPPIIELSSPSSGPMVTLTSPTLSWEGNDDDGDSLTYDVYLDTNPNPKIKVSTKQSEESYTSSGLTDGGTYYWKVIVSDNIIEVESEIWRFTVKIKEKPTIIIDNPSNGEEITGICEIKGRASASEGDEVLNVEIKIDNGDWISVDGTTIWSYSLDTTILDEGTNTIYARSYDGNYYSNTRSLLVNVTRIYCDLEVISIILIDENINWNEEVKITVNVKNNGPSINDVTLSIFNQNSNEQIGSKQFDLADGKEESVEFNWIFIFAGNFKIIAKIDPTNKILETNENNNEDSQNIYVWAVNKNKLMGNVAFLVMFTDYENVKWVNNNNWDNVMEAIENVKHSIDWLYNEAPNDNGKKVFSYEILTIVKKGSNIDLISIYEIGGSIIPAISNLGSVSPWDALDEADDFYLFGNEVCRNLDADNLKGGDPEPILKLVNWAKEFDENFHNGNANKKVNVIFLSSGSSDKRAGGALGKHIDGCICSNSPVVIAHELGHLFGAGHIGDGTDIKDLGVLCKKPRDIFSNKFDLSTDIVHFRNYLMLWNAGGGPNLEGRMLSGNTKYKLGWSEFYIFMDVEPYCFNPSSQIDLTGHVKNQNGIRLNDLKLIFELFEDQKIQFWEGLGWEYKTRLRTKHEGFTYSKLEKNNKINGIYKFNFIAPSQEDVYRVKISVYDNRNILQGFVEMPIRISKSNDFDNDGLSNDKEKELGTDPTNPDSDGDGILDGKDPDVIPEFDNLIIPLIATIALFIFFKRKKR